MDAPKYVRLFCVISRVWKKGTHIDHVQGCGVVEFATAEEAQRAIKEMSDMNFMGRPVYVREVHYPIVIVSFRVI